MFGKCFNQMFSYQSENIFVCEMINTFFSKTVIPKFHICLQNMYGNCRVSIFFTVFVIENTKDYFLGGNRICLFL